LIILTLDFFTIILKVARECYYYIVECYLVI
jgi:hypothetical protein